MKRDKFISDQYDSVYEWNNEAQGYLFVGKLNGMTLEEAIADITEQIEIDQMENDYFSHVINSLVSE